MRGRSFSFVLSLSLVACGSRSALDGSTLGGSGGDSTNNGVSASSSSAGLGGGTPSGFAFLQASCGPTDGPAILLTVDSKPGCPSDAPVGIQFLISGPELQSLGPNTTLTVAESPAADVQGSRTFHTNGSETMTVPMSGGTITFTTFTPKGEASGSFMVDFADGSDGAGTFGASFCKGIATCG